MNSLQSVDVLKKTQVNLGKGILYIGGIYLGISLSFILANVVSLSRFGNFILKFLLPSIALIIAGLYLIGFDKWIRNLFQVLTLSGLVSLYLSLFVYIMNQSPQWDFTEEMTVTFMRSQLLFGFAFILISQVFISKRWFYQFKTYFSNLEIRFRVPNYTPTIFKKEIIILTIIHYLMRELNYLLHHC